MSRPTWVGSLSFGPVHVPVRLYSAVNPRSVQFHQLHDADGARIQQRRVCSADGEEVSYEHVVKGYALEDGRYVAVTRGELEAFDPQSSRSIELEEFVDLADIDTVFFDNAYHLVPDKDSARPYALVVEALRQSGKAGLGRLVMHHRGRLAVVRPFGRGLALSTLHYADEVVSQDSLEELDLVGAQPPAQEVELALQWVRARSASFEPRRYHDVHRERLLAFIDKRARAQERRAGVEVPGRATVPAAHAVPEQGDLLRALEESLAALGRGRPVPANDEGREPPLSGELRLRQEAARTAREPRGPEAPRPRRKKGEGEPEPT
jgi:DNA end-binding protein Ku